MTHSPQPPKHAAADKLIIAKAQAWQHEATIEGKLLRGAELAGVRAGNVSVDESALITVNLSQAQLEKLGLLDTTVQGSVLAAAQCSEASFVRVVLRDCQLTGIDLSRSTLKDVVFENCKLDMANLRFAKLTRVRFMGCSLAETDLQGAELHYVVFERSRLERTVFDQAQLASVDARGSELIDLRGWQALRGLVIDSTQLASIAPQLAASLGLKLQD